jgi:hypothetical protein
MLIYNQRPYQSLSNSTPMEFPRDNGANTLDPFLKQYCNGGGGEKKKKEIQRW